MKQNKELKRSRLPLLEDARFTVVVTSCLIVVSFFVIYVLDLSWQPQSYEILLFATGVAIGHATTSILRNVIARKTGFSLMILDAVFPEYLSSKTMKAYNILKADPWIAWIYAFFGMFVWFITGFFLIWVFM